MPRILSRLRKASIRRDEAQVVRDSQAEAHSDDAKRSRGHDERGRYGKSVGNPESEDTYKDKG